MTEIQIDAGTLTFSEADGMVATGLLVPFNENCRSNLGVFSVEPGAFSIPADLKGAALNIEHAREDVVGALTEARETEAGIIGKFSFADTDEGRQAYADARDGKRSSLSAEVAGVVIKAGKAVAGRLFAAALVAKPAFPSATLLAADTEPLTTTEVNEYTDENGVTWRRVIETETTADENSTTTVTTVTEETTNPESEDAVSTATVPNTLTAAAPKAPARTGLNEVSAALALFSRTGDKALINALAEKPAEGESLFAALNDVKITTAGSAGINILQPQWLGQLWEGRSYARRVIPLINSGVLTSFTVKGFRWTTKPTMGAWAGDKSAVPSNTPATESYSVTAQRYAGGHDIAREYRDFDVPEFWDAYFRAMTDSYAQLTDDAALSAIVGGATTVTAGAVPTGVNSGLVSIIDGALAVLPVGVPTFALVASDVYRSLALVKDVDKLAFLNASLGLEEGALESFKVVPHPGIAAGKVLVGVRNAATSFELPGSPIRTEALDQIKGGIDEALFGYAAVTIDNPAGLALVTPAA